MQDISKQILRGKNGQRDLVSETDPSGAGSYVCAHLSELIALLRVRRRLLPFCFFIETVRVRFLHLNGPRLIPFLVKMVLVQMPMARPSV
jgi:hypothetical protein